MTIVAVTAMQYELTYNAFSLSFAAMLATTLYIWLRVGSVHERFKTPLLISGLVTFIAAYNYWRICDSWEGAFAYPAVSANDDGSYDIADPSPTGVPFNDAIRYMDWLLTVPLLLIEIVLVMKLDHETANKKSWILGTAAALMIVLGYPGELILDEDKLNTRWGFWVAAMIPFVYIVYELIVGLSGALDEEEDNRIRNKIWWATRVTVVSWLTYPFVYIIPMLGVKGGDAVVGIQVGYCISDIIAKCGVGVLISQVTLAKSRVADKGMDAPLVEA